MNHRITLVVLAAGMGSRYGSLKQVDKIGPSGETLTDYSIYDAYLAGFTKVVFVIRKNIEDDFKELFQRINKYIEVDYVFQEIDSVPSEVKISSARIKPWGTGHAVLMAKNAVQTPFAVINADDFYGRDSYKVVAQFLTSTTLSDDNKYCMIGFKLHKTLSEFGYVSRGICEVGDEGYLNNIVERTKIQYQDAEKKNIIFDDDNQKITLSGEETVSMNFWGFSPSIFKYLEQKFNQFIIKYGSDTKAEFYLPMAVNELISENIIKLKVLHTPNDWFGVTYKEDKHITIQRIQQLIRQGEYPANLWQ